MNEFKVSQGYMREFSFFDGEFDVIFDMLDLDIGKLRATICVSRMGQVSVQPFYLQCEGWKLYFEYGVDNTKIYLDDFEELSRFDEEAIYEQRH